MKFFRKWLKIRSAETLKFYLEILVLPILNSKDMYHICSLPAKRFFCGDYGYKLFSLYANHIRDIIGYITMK
ncbi:hypothetical protein [Clostridium estertheticum]|uniref:hypothetical protein n=1 Tax=Clostridium estertheticum TaxID=238834 RepID=UPI001C0BA627|nr:hypothetical protein [Clostridium estertheticum]MBU3156084.1 hypothetical protein [Clostridium estertheticum]